MLQGEAGKSILMVDVSLRNDFSARDCIEGSYRNDFRSRIPMRYFFGASERPTNAMLGMTFLVEDPSVSQKMSRESSCLQLSQEN